MRLLVVEDDPGMSATLARSLRREGYAVDKAGNGEDAVWSLIENYDDAVLLDAMIPPPDGFEACRRMRAEARWAPCSCSPRETPWRTVCVVSIPAPTTT